MRKDEKISVEDMNCAAENLFVALAGVHEVDKVLLLAFFVIGLSRNSFAKLSSSPPASRACVVRNETDLRRGFALSHGHTHRCT